MRDKDRIKPFCDKLAGLWSNYPDLRFGQFMWNMLRHLEHEGKNPFYMEDEEFMKELEYYLRKSW